MHPPYVCALSHCKGASPRGQMALCFRDERKKNKPTNTEAEGVGLAWRVFALRFSAKGNVIFVSC